MNGLIEISVNGDIYLFLNNLTNTQYHKLCNFTISYLKEQKLHNVTFSVEQYTNAVHKHMNLVLSQYIIEKVIAN